MINPKALDTLPIKMTNSVIVCKLPAIIAGMSFWPCVIIIIFVIIFIFIITTIFIIIINDQLLQVCPSHPLSLAASTVAWLWGS